MATNGSFKAMKTLIVTIIAISALSSSAHALTEHEAKQLSGLLTKRSVEVLGPHRPDNKGTTRVVPQGGRIRDSSNCEVVRKVHDARLHGTFRRVVCKQ